MNQTCAVKIVYDKFDMPTHVAPESMCGIHAICVMVTVRIRIPSHHFSTEYTMYAVLWPSMDSVSGACAPLSPPVSVSVNAPVIASVVKVSLVDSAVANGSGPQETFVGLTPIMWAAAKQSQCVQSRLSCIMPTFDGNGLQHASIAPVKAQHSVDTSACVISTKYISPPEHYSCNGIVYCAKCCKKFPRLVDFYNDCGIDAARKAM